MNRNTVIVSAIVSAAVAAFVAVTVFMLLFARVGDVKMSDPPEVSAEKTPAPPTPAPTPAADINEADVSSISIKTEYKNFFAEGSKCRQTYNEYFKNTDGFGSLGSPCSVTLTVNRDGRVEKTIEISRYDTAAKQRRTVEKNTWQAKISAGEFEALAKLIVNNQAFKNWSDYISIYTSNCKITVKHKGGTKSPMSNVDERATSYWPMVEAFKTLDAKLAWEN